MPDVSEHSRAIGGLEVFWRSSLTTGEDSRPAPVLMLHGVPSSSFEWTQLLQLLPGIAPDLPGFGRSGKPAWLFPSIAGYDAFLERFLDELGLAKISLLVHDWGAVGLAFAQRMPQRIHRLAVINAVPLLPGYRWHRTARIWRTPLLGELAMLATTRATTSLLTRESNATPGPMPAQWIDGVMADLDAGSRRSILRLYRGAPPAVLAAAGSGLGRIRGDALVMWGMRDPYIPARFARAYAEALPGAELVELGDAGHWPWLDRPDALALVADFLSAP